MGSQTADQLCCIDKFLLYHCTRDQVAARTTIDFKGSQSFSRAGTGASSRSSRQGHDHWGISMTQHRLWSKITSINFVRES